ncbi:MAG: ankyrin repeat domain-containing protein [Polyangiales bacterium]
MLDEASIAVAAFGDESSRSVERSLSPIAWVALGLVGACVVWFLRRRDPKPVKTGRVAAQRSFCEPSLFDAAADGNVERVRTLIPHCDLSLRSADWVSPLGAAIANGHGDVVELLLDAGADVNAAAVEDRPPLFLAALAGQPQIARLLLHRGAEITHADPVGGTALSAALAQSDEATVEVLLEAGIPLDIPNTGGARALHIAAYLGELQMTKVLLERGAEPDRPNFQGGTPLRSAASMGHTSIVRHLLELGADPAPLDSFGKYPADYAKEAGHSALGELLAAAAPVETSLPARPLAAPLAHCLPPRTDATLGPVQEAFQQGYGLAQAAASALEAPSMIASVRAAVGDTFAISFPGGGDPDARVSTRPVELLLWTYEHGGELTNEARPGLPAPAPEQSALVAGLAEYPYNLRVWSKRAAALASELGPEDLKGVAAVMVHPPSAPEYLQTWDWAFRVQVASALIISHLACESWTGSPPQQALEDIVDGPADWAIGAVIVALYDRACRDQDARASVVEALLRCARREVTPPIYQHIVAPAVHALLQLDVDEGVRQEMLALLLD